MRGNSHAGFGRAACGNGPDGNADTAPQADPTDGEGPTNVSGPR